MLFLSLGAGGGEYDMYSGMSSMPRVPIHPDVRLKTLPFFDILAELLKPSSLGMYPSLNS